MERSVNYDVIATAYDRRYEDNEYRGVEDAVRQFVGEKSDQRILEVGCGTGHWLTVLQRRGFWMAGMDVSARMLTQAKVKLPEAAWVQGRAERLPWAEASFHRIICVNALHHFSDKMAFLTEARRVLAAGGAILTIGLDPHTGVDQWCVYDYFTGVQEMDRRRYPAADQIRQWMSAAGFANCRTIEVEHLPIRVLASEALARGQLAKTVTSQLSMLTDDEYRRGVERIQRDIKDAESRGQALYLTADLRLYATVGALAPG